MNDQSNKDLPTTSALLDLTRPYARKLFEAFLKDLATPADFDSLMGAKLGTFDDKLHSYICGSTGIEIAEDIYLAVSCKGSETYRRNELAILFYNICVEAKRQNIPGNTEDYKLQTLSLRKRIFTNALKKLGANLEQRKLLLGQADLSVPASKINIGDIAARAFNNLIT